MKETIYTIPVNDAFNTDCECPVCVMYRKLELESIDYAMGPSYMEDDIRQITDEKGFCQKHLMDIYNKNNRLGFALVMKTHMDKVISDIEVLSDKESANSSRSFFKKESPSALNDYIKKLNCSCFICDRINNTFNRYIDTLLQMYKSDEAFKELYESSKGFCTKHYGLLMEQASSKLSGSQLLSFKNTTTSLYLNNMKRVRDDVEWFINKFDHKYFNEPWKNAKDSLPRAITKDASLIDEDLL